MTAIPPAPYAVDIAQIVAIQTFAAAKVQKKNDICKKNTDFIYMSENEGKSTKSVYILRIYTGIVCFVQKMAIYHMGIIWICYGYPVVMEAEWKLNGSQLLREGIKVYIRAAIHI